MGKNLVELNFFEKRSATWSNQLGKIVLTAGQFAHCWALNETNQKQVNFLYNNTHLMGFVFM